MRKGRYTPEEDAYLVRHFTHRGYGIPRLARSLDRTEASVASRLLRLRSKGMISLPWGARANGWSLEEDEFLFYNYGVLSDLELVEQLQRTLCAVRFRASIIGASKRENRATQTQRLG